MDTIFAAPHLRWGVIGCGVIANQMAEALASVGRTIDGVANRTQEKAVAFAQKHHVKRVYDSIDELLASDEIDAVYLTTPHNTHIIYLRKALQAGKHVLCEKSITLNSAELLEAEELARQNGVQLMDACTILHMPLYKELVSRVEAGEFGPVNLIQENFGSYKEFDMENRFFNPKLAGGALLDTGVDQTDGILLRNAEGQMVVLALTLHSKQPKRAMISADKAFIEIMEYPRADVATITWTDNGKQEKVQVGRTANALAYVLADLESAVAGDASAQAQLEVSKDVMELMTGLRNDWNFLYPEEQ
ncbi:MAG: Gfo/Idh/MocA family oxidoreductase [Atopobium sp.]|nr:Gfo/Idh/MocA family oxidoreductase [Atopobium sp.]